MYWSTPSMPPSDVIAVAGKDMAAEKVQEQQAKGSTEITEEGGEATSSSSLKSPVTPAAVCESNGTPALRWKSYTKQKDPVSYGKLASAAEESAVVADSKGKLVINLCSIPRSLIKAAAPPWEAKASKVQGMDKRKSDTASTSCQEEHASHCNVDERGFVATSGAEGGLQNLHTGSSDESALPHGHDLDLHSLNCHSKASDLAKKVCRRIRMVRRTLKVSKMPSTSRCRPKASLLEEKSAHSRLKAVTEAKGSPQTAIDVNKDEVCESKRSAEEQHINGVTEEHEEVTGSEDLIYSDDEAVSQRNMMESSVDHESGRRRGRDSTGPTARDQQLEHKKEVSAKAVSSATAGHVSVDATLADVPRGQVPMSAKETECTSRDIGSKDRVYGKQRARSLSHDAGAFSETSKLDVKEPTVLETLLRDEAPGYSSGGGSEQSRGFKVERSEGMEYTQRSGHNEVSQSEDFESGDEESDEDGDDCSESDGYDDEDSVSSESHECEDGDCSCGSLSPVLLGAPGRGAVVNEQVPSVLCDAEGNVWHIGKRAEQARGKASVKHFHPIGEVQKKTSRFSRRLCPVAVQKLDSNGSSGLSVAPYSEQIDFNWKWPSDVDYSISSIGDLSNRSMVSKERSVFVGCIPDGTEKLEDVLQNLMEKFLERFDFAPVILSQIRLVKVVKDFAFLELATEKVAHIVLAANQLDVFEWGINGFHFNIEGCKGTHTSVRPMIEYIPLKPARVVFVGNVPKSRWQKEYLGVFFARILRGADGPADCQLVNCVFLLPESCDAYVELASEIMADAIVFKCIKNPQILKEIGEDVFICRDPSSVPLMSKHKGIVCPQRSLFIGVSAPGQDFKIDAVRKIFEDLLPMISREINQPGYLEFISVQPGKDYAFFQFNSESIVDAVMEEYIKNTHLFVCSSRPLSYIILRPPAYERPGARYRFESNKIGLRSVNSHLKKHLTKFESHTGLNPTKGAKFKLPNQLGSIPLPPRRFGDVPAKKTDRVMSIGVSPLPRATWNGLSSTGACAADPECMLVIEGLPKGCTYKLLRGALNELFEKSLSHTGLLEVGMLILRHLDRDANLGVVASLPNVKFVNALLLLRKPLVVAGSVLRLIPAFGRRKVTWKGSIAEHGRVQGDISCLSNDDVCQDELSKGVKNAPSFLRRKRARPQAVNQLECRKNLAIRRNGLKLDSEVWCEENIRSMSSSPKKLLRGNVQGIVRVVNGVCKAPSRGLKGKYLSKPITVTQWKGNILKGNVPHAPAVKGPLKFGNRDVEHLSEGRSNPEDFHEEILHIVSEGGKRKIQTVGITPKIERGLGKTSVVNVFSRKRKLLHVGQDSSALKAAFIQKNFKKLRRVSRTL